MTQETVMIGDFGKDLDDEHALVLAAGLHRAGEVRLVAVVANLKPSSARACLAKGTLLQLGLPDIPVGIGTAVHEGEKSYPYEREVPYLAEPECLLTGDELLVETLQAAVDKSVGLVLNSGMTDAAKILREHGDLFRCKVQHVAIMGGIETDRDHVKLTDGCMTPNNAHNNTFDWDSAVYLYRRLQECNIPMVVVTREAAYNCQLPFTMYDEMEATGNPIGACLKGRQQPAIQKLFEAACSPPGADIRGTLPADRNREWFVNVFCGGTDPDIPDGGDVWPHVDKFNLYDPMNFVAAVPELRERYYEPTVIEVDGTEHLVIGVSSLTHDIKAVDDFRHFLRSTEIEALTQAGSV